MELKSTLRLTSTSLLHSIFLLSTLISTSLAQTPTSAITQTPTTFLTSIANATAAASSTAYRPQGSDNAPNTLQTPNSGGSIPSSSSPDSNSDDLDDQRSGLLNYYFVFLALFVLLLCLGIYFIHKRKRARKQAFRNSGQNALARDLDGWTGAGRRWMVGHRREESRNTRREEEGFNEFGEAPPPYIHASKAPGAQESGVEGSQVQIPLRTLSTREFERPATGKPPEYGEVIGGQTSGTATEGAITSTPLTSNTASRP